MSFKTEVLNTSSYPLPQRKIKKAARNQKNDKRDAEQIVRCLAHGGYSAAYIPKSMNNSVKEFIRIRDDIKDNLKCIKHQALALLTRNGKSY